MVTTATMPSCSALNCASRTENSRVFAFPANPDRRAKWVQNMRRDKWNPTSGSRLCEVEKNYFTL